MMFLESMNMLLHANTKGFTDNRRTLSLESGSATTFLLQIPMWKKSGIKEVVFLKDGVVVAWFSTFQGKKSLTLLSLMLIHHVRTGTNQRESKLNDEFKI